MTEGAGAKSAAGAFSQAAAEHIASQKEGKSARYVSGEEAGYPFKGTVLPSHDGDEGGSMGFNAQERQPIVIDPDINKDKAVVLQPGQVSGMKENPTAVAAKGYDEDESLRQAALDRMLSGIPASQQSPPTSEETKSQPASEDLLALFDKMRSLVTEPAEVSKDIVKEGSVSEAPKCKITFELGAQFGQFDCYYHRVFRSGMYLILHWDSNWEGSRYSPASSMESAITVYVGHERERFSVYVGPQYHDSDRHEDVVILLIEE